MSPPAYRPAPAQVSFPEMEQRVLSWWAENDIFERSLDERREAPEWVFYEGPPTANGRPGIHHVPSRVIKDLFCRFQTMRGRYVHRKGGWDCHGLPVEIEVEKELGITQKHQIEDEIGIEEFTKRCRESVQRYVADWQRFTDRVGFWLDLEGAYWTMTPDYVESVWWLLKEIWDAGLLEEDFKVVPYCPRCETSLSSHEQHQPGAYQTVTDPSVYVRFPLVDDPDAALLVWTTTPWTLLANMAVAVGPEIEYSWVADPQRPGKSLLVATKLVDEIFGPEAEIRGTVAGKDLLSGEPARYIPPFPFVGSGDTGHTIRAGEFVTTDEGTGIVHLAPYGEDDMMVARRDGLPIVQIIDGSGRVVPDGGEFAGLWFKDADPKIVQSLADRGLLLRSEVYEHAYPHCWRCNTPLIYYARKDWYIRTSRMRDELQGANEATNWEPETIKHGRFGDWLANNVDWSLSRDRYWGTPLPIWVCPRSHATCVGSFAELARLSGRDLSGFDPHRPFVDEVVLACPECGLEARRVKAVIDAWFDSGAMPFAQWHYPFENEDVFARRFPADFISEGIDQTRGWFYSLLAVSTLVTRENSYKNVLVLGLIVDAEGRKMSKSLGNVINPWTVIETLGADALRWYLLTAGSPWVDRRVSLEIVQESLRKFLLTLWNTYSFWVTYASIEAFDPTAEDIPLTRRSEMDRWILAEVDDAVRGVTGALEGFDPLRAGRRLELLVDDLSNWYVRRTRRRFWRSSEELDTRAAFLTLWECLVTIARLLAPFTPFVAEEMFTNLASTQPGLPPSVHLAEWPRPDDQRADDALRRQMSLVRRLVALGRSARTDAKVRVRQPLRRALVVMPADERRSLDGLEWLVAEELNVKALEHVHGVEELVSYSVKPNFKALGPRFGPKVKSLAAALAAADARSIVAALEDRGAASVEVDGERIELGRDDLDLRVEGRPGFSLAREGPYGVALDLDMGPELVAEGVAREVVRATQELRKASGLAVEDRIELWLASQQDEIAGALVEHLDWISSEVLATSAHLEDPPAGVPADDVELDQGTVVVGLRRARA